jgi:hypothetical protein
MPAAYRARGFRSGGLPPLPSGELHRDDPEPNTASATGDHRQDRIVIAERLPQTHVAVAFATGMHAGQQRADGTPFILHPPEVATRLCLAGAPDHLIAAEYPTSSNVSASGLRQRFGPRITEPVLAVTGDEQINAYANRNAALRRQSGAGDEALTLFAADKLCRLGELRREAAANPGGSATPGPVRESRARRLMHYQRSLALLEKRQPESPLVREPTTSSPSSDASALWPGGPADTTDPPDQSARSPDRQGRTGAQPPRKRDRSSAALMPVTCVISALLRREPKGSYYGFGRRLVYRGRRRQPEATFDVMVARRQESAR